MALIKSLLAPIRRVAHFPLFQFAVVVAVILWLQAADSNSVFGEIFSALDWLVDFSVSNDRLCSSARVSSPGSLPAAYVHGASERGRPLSRRVLGVTGPAANVVDWHSRVSIADRCLGQAPFAGRIGRVPCHELP
jgi:hypothetical protein